MKLRHYLDGLLCGLSLVVIGIGGVPVSLAQTGNQPPLITAIEFPKVVPFQAVIEGKLSFRDPDADVMEFRCSVSAPLGLSMQCLDPPLTQEVEGSIRFAVASMPIFDAQLLASPLEAVLHFTIVDSAGNSSFVDFPFLSVSKDEVLTTMIQQAATRTGLSFLGAEQVFVLTLDEISYSNGLSLLLGPLENAPIRLETPLEALQTLVYPLEPKADLQRMLVDSFALSRLEKGDRLIASFWEFKEGFLFSPAIVDSQGVVKFDPILLRSIAPDGLLTPGVHVARQGDPEHSFILNSFLATLVEAEFKPDVVPIASVGGKGIKIDGERTKSNLQDRKPDVRGHWGYQADGMTSTAFECVEGCDPISAELECAQFNARVAWAFSPFVKLSFTFEPGVGIEGFYIPGTNGVQNLYLTKCADRSVRY